MPDFRVADTAPENRKLRAAGLAAAGLWALAGAYSMRELTDGWVPEYWITTWPAGKRQATTLVGVGLWQCETRQGIPGYAFHDWDDYQRPASKIHEDRAKGRERAQRSRERSGARSREVTADVRSASHDSLSLSLPLTPSGSVGRGASGTERDATRNARPRCPQHEKLPVDQQIPACRDCKQLRVDAAQHVADQAQQAAAQRAQRRASIDACQRCDDNGMRDFGDVLGRCTHPDLEIAS